MCNIYRTKKGKVCKAGKPVDLSLADGSKTQGVWGGSATEEKLDWWIKKPGHELTQTEEVAEVGVKDNKTDDIAWAEAPDGARLLFVLEAPVVGKNGASYRIAKMVTREATQAEAAYFQEPRCALFGTMKLDRSIRKMAPLPAPPPRPSAQGELW